MARLLDSTLETVDEGCVTPYSISRKLEEVLAAQFGEEGERLDPFNKIYHIRLTVDEVVGSIG